MPSRVIRSRREIDFIGIEFAEGTEGENQRARYAKLFNREVVPTRYAHEIALHDSRLYNSPTYVRPTYEILSSFYYSTQPSVTRVSGTVKFRIFNVSYEFNQD